MKQDVVLPQPTWIIMGKDAGFYMVIRMQVTTRVWKIWHNTSLIYMIRWMSRAQNWSRMIQNTVFMAHKDTANLSTKTCISQTASVNAQCARQWRVVPLGQA